MVKKCPRCKSDQIITDAGCCSVCGTNVSAAGQEDSDQLDLIVREVPEDDREFVGGSNSETSDRPDKLENKPANKPRKSGSAEENRERERAFSYDPIGFSEPTLPPVQDSDVNKVPSTDSVPVEKPVTPEPGGSSSAGSFKKLTPEEVKAIEQNLYGKSSRLADKEKASIRNKINEIENQATDSPKAESKPEKAPILSETFAPAGTEPTSPGRGRGVAYFYKNYIKLPGQQHLTKHDELLLNGKLYALQPKRIKQTYLYVAVGLLFGLVLLLVASWFVKDAADGQGQIAGVVLDSKDKPHIKGASIRFPDLGITVETNAQGLFSTEDIPVGAHRVEYIVDGRVIGSDHATVLDHGVSVLALRPSSMKTSQKKISKPSTSSNSTSSRNNSTSSPTTSYRPPAATASNNSSSNTKSQTQTKSTHKPAASISLAANVDGAKFVLDGKVMGAGNLKYSQIKPGIYKYEVSAAGYESETGTLNLSDGESETLKITLKPATKEEKKATYSSEDYFHSGVNALKDGHFDNAISDFTQALKDNPSFPQAIYNRGLAYQALKKSDAAHDDFLKAAEIYKFKSDLKWSMTSYNRAIDVNSQSLAALIGRGELFLTRGEERAALGDFDEVTKIDKRNYAGYVGLGRCRYQQGNYKQALEHFKDARSVNKDDPEIYQWLMLAYMGVNDFEELKKSYEKFQELASESQKQAILRDRRFTAALEIIRRH